MADNARKLGIQIDVSATGNGGEKAAKDLERVNNAAKNGTKPIVDNAKAADSLSSAIEKLGSRNNAAKDTLEGLAAAAHGGEGAIFGMAKAVKGLSELLGSGLKLTAVGLVVGAITGAVKLLDSYNDRLRTQIDQLLNAKSAAERLKPEYEAMAAAAKKSADDQISAIVRLEDEFKSLDDRATEATDRISALSDANKRLELAQLDKVTADKLRAAKTPEDRDKITSDAASQRQAIEDRFADIKSENEKLRARLDIRNAEDRIAQLREQRRPASAELASAEQEASSAKETAKAFADKGGDISSPFGQELQDNIRVATKRVEELKKALSDIDKTVGPEIDTLEARIRKSKTQLEVNAVERKAQSTEQASRKTEELAQQDEKRRDRRKKIDELGQRAEEAAATGDFAAQSAAVDERRKLLAQQAAEGRAQRTPSGTQPTRSGEPATGGTINGEPLKPISKVNTIERAGDKVDQAAEKLSQAEPIKAEKLGDSLEEMQQDFSSKLDESQKSIDKAASTVDSLKSSLPPPLDLAPFTSSFEQFASENAQLHRQSQSAIQQVSSRVAQLAAQLASLKQ